MENNDTKSVSAIFKRGVYRPFHGFSKNWDRRVCEKPLRMHLQKSFWMRFLMRILMENKRSAEIFRGICR